MSADPSPPAFDPYAAPREMSRVDDARADAESSAPGLSIKWVYLAFAALSAAAAAGVRIARWTGMPPDTRLSIAYVDIALAVLVPVIGLVWVHRAWKGIAYPDRRGIQLPSDAIVRFFFPLYNFYWAFKCNQLWCDSINGALARIGDGRRAPLNLAMIGAAFPILARGVPGGAAGPLGWVMTVASYGVWLAYMRRCDDLRVAVAMADAAAAAEPDEE